MNLQLTRQLARPDIERYSSAYIDQGVKRESWRIEEIDVQGDVLRARIRMDSVLVSPTDPRGYHLTIFSVQEFLAQLSNTYLHLAAGAEGKERETWMRECSIKTHTSIRDRDRILVEMNFMNVRRLANSLYAQATARVYDDGGGCSRLTSRAC